MKINYYKLRANTLLLAVALTGFTFAGATAIPTSSEVIGTLSTGLGNSSVSGIVIAAPVASIPAGTYTSVQSVTLTSPGSLNIRYTTDGTVPNCTTSTVYSTAISVSSSQTIKALSCYSNSVVSSIATYSYTISIPVVTSGGGGGGGGGFISSVPPVSVATTSTTTVVAIQPISNVGGSSNGQVLGVVAYNFLNDLRMGSSGNDVKELQKILIAGGFLKSEATGYFGNLTRAALIKWQTKNNLKASGYLDLPSRNVLSPKTDVANTSTSTAKVSNIGIFTFTKNLGLGSRNDDVKELQKILIAEGFLKGEATGYFGILTRESLVKWQIKNGLPSTGFFGAISRAKLNK